MLNLRRHRIGVVFQAGELLEDLAPVENVALAGMLAGQRRDDAYAEATNLLHALQVHSDVERSSDLSGGEQQRVAVARALMGDPALVVADEPTAALDQQTRRRVAEVVYALPKTHGVALIIATHDRDIAEQADAIISLSSDSKATDSRQPC